MLVKRSWLLGVAGAAVVVAVAWAVGEFSPNQQVRRAFLRLVHAAEKRDWSAVRDLMDADYRDDWGFDRGEALRLAAEGFRHFLVVEIVCENPRLTREGAQATVEAAFQLRGRGDPVAEAIMERANSLHEDFRFAWRRKSWKPWDWKLVSVHQDEIEPNMLEIP